MIEPIADPDQATAEHLASWRDGVPKQERDYAWLGTVMAEHYAGDDTKRTDALGRSPGGDIPMLEFTRHQGKPFLALLLLHDDADREFDYTSGAEQADTDSWTVVSIKNDWATVFGG